MEVSMGKYYYRIMFAIFWCAFIICGGLRVYLKLWKTDPTTGFYRSESIFTVMLSVLLAVTMIAMLLLNRLKRVYNDYPMVRQNRYIGFFSVLSGISIALFTIEQTGWLTITNHVGTPLHEGGVWLCGILGVMASLVFIANGLYTIFTRKEGANGVLLLIPTIWQASVIVVKYNSYNTLTTNCDNLLIILFMTASILFLMGNARTICGFSRKNGRNYTLPAGLIVSMTGLLLTIPNYIYRIVWSAPNPAMALGDMESIYITIFSVYAFACVTRLRRSIAFV